MRQVLPIVFVFGFLLQACGGMFAGPPRPAGTPEDADCMVSSGGEVVCGYHCMMGSDGVVNCADTKDGTCSMNFDGGIDCTQKLATEPPATDPGTEPAGTDPAGGEAASTQPAGAEPAASSSDAYCCVNGAYYECPDASEAAICLGEPVQLMSCVQNCPMMGSGGCEEDCIADHGPRPQESKCTRTPARDGECPAQ